jgi:outer membrane murein-binding lipoprotein Lpp
MTAHLRSPRGLSLRDSVLLATIVASMALSACMTSLEKNQRAEAVERLKADQIARIEQAEKEEKEERRRTKEADEANLKIWVKENEQYLRELCTTVPGPEHRHTWNTFRVAVSTDLQHAAEAATFRRPIINCEELSKEKTSALGYTWSNATRSIAGVTP